jgi:sterol desaturase/sphingolipid hydroxylase (fatty acid hydroxylase superfamily)
MLTSLIEWPIDTFAWLQTILFESVVQPIAFAGGAGNLLDVAFEGTGWLLVGLLQIVLLMVLIAPLEKWRPIEPITDAKGVKTDVIYTLIHRLGLFKLVMFFTFENVVETAFGMLRVHGLPTFNIDAIWPGVSDIAWVSFFPRSASASSMVVAPFFASFAKANDDVDRQPKSFVRRCHHHTHTLSGGQTDRCWTGPICGFGGLESIE